MAEIKKIRYLVINENHFRVGDRINSLCWKENGEEHRMYNGIVYAVADDGFTMWDEILKVKVWIPIEDVVEE